jgi:hypothetical protein
MTARARLPVAAEVLRRADAQLSEGEAEFVCQRDGGHPIRSSRLPRSGAIPLQIAHDRVYEPYGPAKI